MTNFVFSIFRRILLLTTEKMYVTIGKRQDKMFAQIAQLVEQRTENPRVTGSIPVLGIFLCITQI